MSRFYGNIEPGIRLITVEPSCFGFGLFHNRGKQRVIPWEVRGIMTQKQKSAVVGMVLGDAYLQKTGSQNARLRLEHSIRQKEYLEWKVSLLKNYFQDKLHLIERFHKKWSKTYKYVRIQSTSSSDLGKIQRLFYRDSIKVVPKEITTLLKQPLALAIWFMDDGYYYPRDKISYIYISNFSQESIDNLLLSLKENFNLSPILKMKKKGLVLIFSVIESAKLMQLIKKFVVPSMSYKIPLDPVSTDRNHIQIL